MARTGIIVVVILLLFVASAGAYYFFVFKPEQAAIEKARLEQIAKEEAAKKAAEEAARKKTEYESLIQSADVAFEGSDWNVAQSDYTAASGIFPNEQYPKDQLAIVNARLDAMARAEAGTMETVSTSTGRFYVVVSSSIDDDLAMDFGKKLMKEGIKVKILEPLTQQLFYRVTVGDYDTREQAVAAATSFTDYAADVWVLNY